jgi:hypothetical protein
MKRNTLHLTPLKLLSAATFILASCTSTPTPPPDVGSARIDYTKGVPGGTITQTFKTSATVTAMDQAKRTATLRGSDGKKFLVQVGPAAVNFDQVRVGDLVNATVMQRIVAHLGHPNTTANDGTAAGVALAGKGDQPGGVVAETTQVTARIVALDSSKRTATLRFEDGKNQTLPIREDVDMSRLKVGDQAVFRVTEMIAINIDKPQ